jgi:transcriptional regulator with XRE-family HTH domain
MGQEPTADELIGRNLAAVRKAAGARQEDVAAAMRYVGFEWQRDTVAQVESGNRRIGFDELAVIAAYFELPPTYFIATPLPGAAPPLLGSEKVGWQEWANLWTSWDIDEPSPRHKRRAIDRLFKGLDRPWARFWRKSKKRAESFVRARDEMLSERERFPGPIFVADTNVEWAAPGLWGVQVSIHLQAGVPYVARDEIEAAALQRLAEESSDVRRIPRHTAHYLRKKLERKKGT